MEKYSVVLDEHKTKTASRESRCPKCSIELLDKEQYTLICPKCGTEPFEKRVK